MKFVLATFNRDKARELKALLDSPWIEIHPLYEFAGAFSPGETGVTLHENARIKAHSAVRQTGLPAIGDDTGLEVDALGGKPGVYAARFAGPNATYADNVHRLLQVLEGVEPRRRTARFRTVCVACFPDGDEQVGEGVLEGRITESPRGAEGFGYDPVFEVEGLGQTLAELSHQEKNRLSHRAKAVMDLAAKIKRKFGAL